MNYNAQRALQLLRLGTQNPGAGFRDGQENAIRHVVEGRGRLLVVQKTGWGKSFVYFIATKLLREQGAGPALLISPLLALMRNQIAAAERMGVHACTINSDNQEEWMAVEAALGRNEVDILLISPERLANEHFRAEVLARFAGRISLLVIDEAHCISDWGHDFRPHYRLLERIVRTLPQNLRLLATTATANNRVLDDLQTVLGPNLTVSRGDLARPSLFLQTIRLPSQAERLAWLAQQLPTLQGSGIIYTLTVRDAAQVAEWLRSRRFNVQAYTGETGERRPQLEQALLNNQVKALVATTALGMGFDKPDLAFVIHFQTPGSVVAYYQQVGRAGRALESAYGVLLSGQEEEEINDYFIESAFPSREEVEQVLAALHAAPAGLSINELMVKVNASWGRLDKAVQLMSLESPAPIVKQGSKWTLTTTILADSFWQRAERLTALRRVEQGQMQQYVALPSCHMEFLIRALDGDPGQFHPPNLPALPTAINEALVRRGKYHDRRFADDLVNACERLVREWSPQPAPSWVTCIPPSRRHPELVPDFARRLATALNLPFHLALEKTDDRPEQKTMANSSQQARNIDGSLAVNVGTLPAGPVLLVDDMVDSRWTLTVAAWLLTANGGRLVYPLALASTANAE